MQYQLSIGCPVFLVPGCYPFTTEDTKNKKKNTNSDNFLNHFAGFSVCSKPARQNPSTPLSDEMLSYLS
jgi:hypothetical protein